MAESFEKLTPDSKFVLINAHVNRDLDHSVLTNLYQPIIGEQAIALYNLLWSLSLNDHNQMVLHKHYEIQSMLNSGISDLLGVRKRLEAVKLIRTLMSPKRPDTLIYALNEPLSPEQFLRTDILSIILLGKVGDSTYKQIVERLVTPTPDLGETNDISASLLSTYDVPKNLVKNIPGVVNEAKATINQFSNQADQLSFEPDSTQFDFKLLLRMLENSYVDEASVKAARDLILSEHLLYGIDEIQMSKLILRATNLSNNQLKQNQLKAIITDSFTLKQAQDRQPVIDKKPDLQTATKNYDAATKQLISISKTNSPVAFLRQIKKQKNGIVTSGEQRTLSELVTLRVLPNDVMNILIYYLLVDEKHSTLNKNLMSSIADDWSQHGVVTAEKAVVAIKQRPLEKQKEAAKRRAKYANQRRVTVKETLPDWAKEDHKETAKSAPQPKRQLTEAQKKQLKEQLDQLKKPGK